MMRFQIRCLAFVGCMFLLLAAFSCTDCQKRGDCCKAGPVVLKTVMETGEDPAAVGKRAAEKLKIAMGDAALKAVVVSECFEDREYKEKLIQGICAVIPEALVYGQSTYGSFTQSGCTDFDAVCLLGIGGGGVNVSAGLVDGMNAVNLDQETQGELLKQRLGSGGRALAAKLKKTGRDRLLILFSDAHSPKNQFLVAGAQEVMGAAFPITGGSANKNAGQTLIYYRGKCHTDSAVGLLLSGNFKVALSGRKAQDNDAVIKTAREGAKEAMQAADGKPVAVLAFNCAGRRGKLNRFEDELEAMQAVLGKALPLFGCYCAGEIGPRDEDGKDPDVLSSGVGWHVMFTILHQAK